MTAVRAKSTTHTVINVIFVLNEPLISVSPQKRNAKQVPSAEN
jgi:hypothetical protein